MSDFQMKGEGGIAVSGTGSDALYVDLWANRPPGLPPNEQAPDGWGHLPGLAGAAICYATLEVLSANPDKVRPGDRAWLVHRIRERLQGLSAEGDKAAQAAMGGLQTARFNNAMLLDAVVSRLLAAGSLLKTLQMEHAAKAAVIARLSTLAPR